MANNSFLAMQQDLCDRANTDQTIAGNATRAKRYINQAVQTIASRWTWKWLSSRTLIQTVVDETAGTVTVTKGSKSVSGTSTAFVSADANNSFIQFTGNNDWYGIASYSSATSITLDTALGQSTITNGTYIVRRLFYSLPSSVDRVIDVRGFNLPNKLTQLGETTLDAFDPDYSNVGQPLAYSIIKPDPTVAVSAQPQWQLCFDPIPDAVYNLEVRTTIIPTDMSADTDICIVPYKNIGVVLDLAEYYYAKHQNDPNSTSILQQAELGIQRMIENSGQDEDRMYVLQPEESPSTEGFIPFPGQYERP